MVRRLFVVALTLAPATLLAQQSRDTVELKPVVVTATRVPVSPNAVTSSVTVLTGEEIHARGLRFVGDALREVPGAAVVPTGSFGGITSLFLRGGESDYVKVLIDGVPVNRPGGSFDWANLTTDNVERIEVVRGPSSVIYGSDAMTGVVQIFTKRGRGRPSPLLRGEGGTYGTMDLEGGVSGGTSRVSYSADVAHFTTNGIYNFNNDYRNTVLSGAFRFFADSRTDLSVSGRYSDNRYRFPTDFTGVPVDSNQLSADKDAVIAAEIGRRLGNRFELRLSAGGSRARTNTEDSSDSPADTVGFSFASRTLSIARRGNVDARLNAFVVPGVTLTAGAQVEGESENRSGETTSNFGGIASRPNVPFDSSRTTVAFYGQGVVDLASGLATNVNARVDDNSVFGTFVTFRAGAAYRLPTGTRARASVGRSFKAPTFCEQLCNEPFNVGNPTLDPERATSWEVGLEQSLAKGQAQVSVTYFDQRFTNMVIYDGTAAPGDPTYRNGAAAFARGVEAGVSLALGARVSASASYTYLDTKVTDDGGQPSPFFAADTRLVRRPKHSAQVALRWRVADRATLGGSLGYVGKRDDVRTDRATFASTREELAAYVLVGLAASVDLLPARAGRPGVAVTGRVENLFDKGYENVAGYPGRGRGIFGGVRVGL